MKSAFSRKVSCSPGRLALRESLLLSLVFKLRLLCSFSRGFVVGDRFVGALRGIFGGLRYPVDYDNPEEQLTASNIILVPLSSSIVLFVLKDRLLGVFFSSRSSSRVFRSDRLLPPEMSLLSTVTLSPSTAPFLSPFGVFISTSTSSSSLFTFSLLTNIRSVGTVTSRLGGAGTCERSKITPLGSPYFIEILKTEGLDSK